jgi:hypothetical protein
MLGLLDAHILNPRLPEKRVQQVRKERNELELIYEATWLELENAIGSKAAEAIRESLESVSFRQRCVAHERRPLDGMAGSRQSSSSAGDRRGIIYFTTDPQIRSHREFYPKNKTV